MVEAVTITSEDKGPSLEDEAKAQDAAAAAASTEDTPLPSDGTPEERPEWLPEKFKSPEDMAKAYAELEKSQGRGEKPEGETDTTEESNADKAVKDAGLDMTALQSEFAEKGELADESYEALAKAGIPKEMVDAYIAGQEAKAAEVEKDLLGPVGGKEAYQEMVEWAGENLSEADIDAFNSVLDTGDANAMKLAVKDLHSKFTEANGADPARQVTGKGTASTVGVYESTQDLMKDMQSPEYAKNPAFRAKVEAKLARSNIM